MKRLTNINVVWLHVTIKDGEVIVAVEDEDEKVFEAIRLPIPDKNTVLSESIGAVKCSS